MQLTKTQKALHVIFRVLVFLTLGAGICEFFLFITTAVAADSTVYSYSSVLLVVRALCSMYYIELILSFLTVIFSIVCFRAVSVAATVVRTFFLVMAAGFNVVAYPAYETIRRFSSAYLSGDHHSVIREYRTYSGADFESIMAIVLTMLIFVILIYFVLSVTSIAALAKRQRQQINPGYQQYYQQLYGRYQYGNGQCNNYGYGNPDMQNYTCGNQGTGVSGKDIYDENGVKQGTDGRKILYYDTMTGEPVYQEEQKVSQTENQEKRQEEAVNNENQNTTLL